MLFSNRKELERPRAQCQLRLRDISAVICHRHRDSSEQYLVRWRPSFPDRASAAVCSWHEVGELLRILPLVQIYVESVEARDIPTSLSSLPSQNRKRKSPDEDPYQSRDNGFGYLTPSSRPTSASPSILTEKFSVEKADDIYVYNGRLERKEGWISARTKKNAQLDADAQTLPTQAMVAEAARTQTTEAELAIRRAFERKIRKHGALSLENDKDNSTPSLNFTFIKDYVLRDGVSRVPPEEYEGCGAPCRPNMGQNIGCEYTTKCGCLQYAAVDEEIFKKKDPETYQAYVIAMEAGGEIDTTGLPKRFPYLRSRGNGMPQTLQAFYRESRHPIYECNVNCNCGPVCKSRLVQRGRRVPLTIFKTPNRGWGVYCNEHLIQGEFIDTYLGEVITEKEAVAREEAAGKDKASYFYNLDKFVGDSNLQAEDCYTVDGQYMGGPTRFINHSCEPNCRQYTVSYNRHDLKIYDLAFFAYEDISAGTELTFDYLDKDEEEEEEVLLRREQAKLDPGNKDKIPCNCGATKCRGYLWV